MNKPYKIYSESIEGAALSQFFDAMKQDCVVKGALMPDAHAGYTLPIGAVIAVEEIIFPSAVGYDIGCGVAAIKTSFLKEDVRSNAKAIFDNIYKAIPVGFNHNDKASDWAGLRSIRYTSVVGDLLKRKGSNDLYSLGGGNHFIEIGFDENDAIWIVLHSGSRNMGHSVAKHYMGVASGDGRPREGFYGLSEASDDGQAYIADMNFCLAYALENRRGIIGRVGESISRAGIAGGVLWDSFINRNHNHAEKKDGLWIHRKGATHAEAGMSGVIPGNMRDGSFIVRGLGNPDSLYSSSHGAGRIMGRAEAKRTLDMETFAQEMAERGIQARIEDATLDEAAGAYKNIFEVMALQKDLVEIVHHVTPLINIKG